MPTTARYYPKTGTPSPTPPYDASWNDVEDAGRLDLSTVKGTWSTQLNCDTSTVMAVCLAGQAIGPNDLPAGIVSGTFRGVMSKMSTSFGTSSPSYLRVVLRVVSNDGATERGILFAGQGTVMSANVPSQSSRLVEGALTPVIAQAGDRLVLEYGAYIATTSTVGFQSHSAGNPDSEYESGLAVSAASWFELALDDPNPPTNLSGTPDFESIDLEWEPPAAGPTPDGYTVAINNGVQTDVGDVTSWTATNLPWNRPIDVHVRAYSAGSISIPAMATINTLLPTSPWIAAPLVNTTARRWWEELIVDPETGEHFWWDGAELVPADLLGWWDGDDVQPAALLGYWDGSTIQALA